MRVDLDGAVTTPRPPLPNARSSPNHRWFVVLVEVLDLA
jgi:hypothetical protein